MFNFFKKKAIPSLKSIDFNNFSWERRVGVEEEHNAEIKIWDSPDHKVCLAAYFFPFPNELPCQINDITSLRNYHRNTIVEDKKGGLIKLDVFYQKHIPVIERIYKIPMEAHGMAYLGAFILPFKHFHYLIKLDAWESEMTGTREAVILPEVLSEKRIEFVGNEMKGWNVDPYDPTISSGTPMNLSELEVYDSRFPNHPLSRVRQHMAQIRNSLQLKNELFQAENL